MSNIKIGVIGGGAAGMMAAITAARQGAKVTLIEGNPRLGKKILSTGNGKCNLGNRNLDVSQYYTEQPEMLERFLEQFNTWDTISFFQGLGVVLKEKNGYLYPASEQAAVVQDALRYELDSLHVEEILECKVNGLKRDKQTGMILVDAQGASYAFDRVILACGGQAAPKTGSDGSGYELAKQLGHSLVPVVPALVQLRCREAYMRNVAGVRADAEISVLSGGKCVAKERGELQLTDYGVSGIPIFQLSRVVNYILKKQSEVELVIDCLPDYTEQEYEQLKTSRSLLLQGERNVEEFFTGMLHKKLMVLFIRLAGLNPRESAFQAQPGMMEKVYLNCRQWHLHVTGSNSFDNAQVCAGGVPLDEVTVGLGSKKVPGIYFAGEILDVDGKCGGYNLQWAWCSGYLAAMAASKPNTPQQVYGSSSL